ncbi:DUF417 family protein [Sphingobacterium faecium]|uniref:DUF417 family protein n=1 Tax=Sphingobacterium faecium TaxID=34087 RepID=UPI00320AAAB0
MQVANKNSRSYVISSAGYYISLFGSFLILLWVGIFKFTPTEAQAIKPLIENHPMTSWMYDVIGVQTVSNIIGIIEIIVALLLLLTLKFEKLKKYAGVSMCVIFLMTLSYLLTTPNIWSIIDGVPHTDFFILKDLMYLGFAVQLMVSRKL